MQMKYWDGIHTKKIAIQVMMSKQFLYELVPLGLVHFFY